MNHAERKHAKLSASGAERWVACPGSVTLSEGIPSRDTVWSLEGTRAHEVLERVLKGVIHNSTSVVGQVPRDMLRHAMDTARFIHGLHKRTPNSELLVEGKVSLDFISPDMGGTFDGAVVDFFGTLHVFDYKYGVGHVVSPEGNLQAIVYGLGLAHRYGWLFERVRLWIVQPRIEGYQGPAYWEISIEQLRVYVQVFQDAVERVRTQPTTYKEGPWCFFCSGKAICPLKIQEKVAQGKRIFRKVATSAKA